MLLLITVMLDQIPAPFFTILSHEPLGHVFGGLFHRSSSDGDTRESVGIASRQCGSQWPGERRLAGSDRGGDQWLHADG